LPTCEVVEVGWSAVLVANDVVEPGRGPVAAGEDAAAAVADGGGASDLVVDEADVGTELEGVVVGVDEERVDGAVAKQGGEVLEDEVSAGGVGEGPGDVGERRPAGGVVVGVTEHEADAVAECPVAGGGGVAVEEELGDGVAAELGAGEGGDVGALCAVAGLAAVELVDLGVDDLFEDFDVGAGEAGAELGERSGA